MALVVSATSKALSGGLSPRAIPGCFLWLDAADTSTITLSGSNVTQWNDKSGLGYNASNVGNGFPTYTDASSGVYFNGFSQLRTSAPSSNRTETGFLVTTFLGGSARTSIGASAAGYRSIQFDGSTGYIINRDVLLVTSTPAILPSGRRMLFSYTCADSAISLDASQIATGVPANFTQGSGVTWIGNDSRGFTYFGNIHEIILFSNALTPSQQQVIEGYLSQKWNLSNRIPVSHPYKAQPAFLRPFGPLDISGCLVWVDAQDRSSYTLSNSNVTQWNDKSGNGHNFVRMGGGPTVSTLSGAPSMLLNGTSMSNATVSIPTSYSIFATVNRLSGQDYQYVSKFHVETDSFLFFGTSNGNFATFAGAGVGTPTWADVNGNSPSVAVGSTPILLEAVNDGSTITPYTNGTAQNTKVGTTAVATGMTIGSDRLGGQTLNGNVGELVLFSRPIRAAERELVEGYLAWRWGRQANLPSSHPYRLYRPLVPAFGPLNIPGCALWLDAIDNSTITFTGSNLTSWRDKSGNGYDFTTAPPGCALPRLGNPINGRQTIGITTATMGIRQTSIIDGLKTIVWVRRERTGNRGYEFYFGADSSADFHTGVSQYAGSGFAQNGVRDASLTLLTASGTTSGTLGGTNVSAASDVNILEITNLTGSTRVQGLSYDRGNTGRSMQCDWGELLFYTTALTSSQLRALEGYLAERWGIRSHLSSTHPFKVLTP